MNSIIHNIMSSTDAVIDGHKGWAWLRKCTEIYVEEAGYTPILRIDVARHIQLVRREFRIRPVRLVALFLYRKKYIPVDVIDLVIKNVDGMNQ